MRDEKERAKGKSRKNVLSDLERKRSAADAAAKSAAENADELGERRALDEQLAGQADIRERARQVQFVNAGIGNRALISALTVPKTPGGPVDWDMWRNMPTAMLWEAVALSMGDEPGDRIPPDVTYFSAGYKNRLRVAEAHLATGKTLHCVSGLIGTPGATVSLPEFGTWAASLGWNLPAEFPRAPVAPLMGTQQTERTPIAMPRQRAQEAAILAKLAELRINAQAVPVAPAGKPLPAKQAVRKALGYSADVMNKAWQRLRTEGSIKDA